MPEEIISNEELLQLIDDVAQETLTIFEDEYGEEVEFTSDMEEYLLALAVITLFGWQALKKDRTVPGDIKEILLEQFPKDYAGARAQTVKEFNELQKKLGRPPLAQDINNFRLQRLAKIQEGLVDNTYNEIQYLSALDNGYQYVGAVNTPPNVRPSHQTNNRRYWRVGTYAPWHDYNCKCRYVYFKSITEAEEAGYSRL